MAGRSSALQPLTAEEKATLRTWLTAFVQTWTPSSLTECVESLPPAGDRLRLPALIEMVKLDLRRRWEQGERITIESYLECYPEVGTPETAPVGLVKTEYEARQLAGTPAPLEELANRFPRQTTQLSQPKGSPPTMLPAPRASETIAPEPQPETPVSPSTGPKVPERIGRYRVLRKLGAGGMGSVYLVHDDELDRDVALKVPRFDPEESEYVRGRFHREARAAAALRHPNVCPIYEIGEIDGVPYLTMAFLDGRPLTDYVDRGGGVSPVQAALLVRKLALAMKDAHAQGIVHRDLKPGNVMIDQRKEPVIMDFGLARLERQEASRLTKLGAVLGTPQYMPPEQVAGDLEHMGPACDIYSLGIILYELLTGRTPFTGPPALVIGMVLTQESPPPSSFRPGLDGEIEAICRKAIARKPQDRFGMMEELASALGVYIKRSTRGQAAPPPMALATPAPIEVPVAVAAPVAIPVPTARLAPEPPVAGFDSTRPVDAIPLLEPAPDEPARPPWWRSLPAMICGGVALCALLALVIWAVTRSASTPPPPPGSPPPPPPAKLRMSPLRPLTIDPNDKELLRVTVVRENCTGPIQLELDGLPNSILSARGAILQPGEDVYTFELFARQDAACSDPLNIRVVARLNDAVTECWTTLTIRAPGNPAPTGSLSLEMVREISVTQGRSTTWEVLVRRTHYEGPVQVFVEGLPQKVASAAVTVAAEENLTKLEVVAAANAVQGTTEVRVVATAGMLRTHQDARLTVKGPVCLEIHPVKQVVLRAGDKAEVEVRLKRVGCEGNVEVRLEELPEFMRSSGPITIPAEEDTARFTLTATAIVIPELKMARVVARCGEATGERQMLVRVVARNPIPRGMK